MTSSPLELTAPPSRLQRLLAMNGVRLGLALVVTALAGALTARLLHAHTQGLLHALAPGLGGAAAALAAYVLYVRLVERRRPDELAASAAPRELALGLLGGAALVTLVVAGLAALGVYRFEGLNAHPTRLAAAMSEMVFAGVLEELLLRAVVLRLLERWWGSWAALALSSLLFGLLHLPGEGMNLLALTTTVAAGLLLGAAYLATRRLWLSVALHAGWNFTLGSVFSIAVSGHDAARGLLLGRLSGPDWLTGGAYGLEASALTLVLLLGGSAGLLARAAAHGTLQPRNKTQAKPAMGEQTPVAAQG